MAATSALQKRTPQARPDDTRYARLLAQGSPKIRGMLDAAAMSSPPTLSASGSTQPTGYSVRTSPSSSILRYSGAPPVNISGSYYARGARNLTDTIGAWGGCWGIEVDHYDDDLVWQMQVPSGAMFKLWVNEQPVAIAPVLASGVTGVSGSGTNYFKYAFGSRAWRRLRLEMFSNSITPAAFGGIYNKVTGMLVPPSIPSPKLAIIGDSYDYGVGVSVTSWVGNAYSIKLARALGYAQVYNFTGVPSTGIIKTNAPYGAYNTRLTQDVIPLAPDVLIYQCSVNDGGSVGQGIIGPQMRADLALLKGALPNTKIIATSPGIVAAPTISLAPLSAENAAAAAAAGVPYVDIATKGYWTGTGSSDAPNGSGNSDVFAVNVGGFHPTDAGADAMARLLAAQIAPLVGQAT